MARGKGFVTTMNLCLPGLGQLLDGRWITGAVILLLSLLFFLAGTYWALAPLIRTIRTLLSDPSGGTIDLHWEPLKIAVCYGLVIILWIFSILEGILHREQKEKENE